MIECRLALRGWSCWSAQVWPGVKEQLQENSGRLMPFAYVYEALWSNVGTSHRKLQTLLHISGAWCAFWLWARQWGTCSIGLWLLKLRSQKKVTNQTTKQNICDQTQQSTSNGSKRQLRLAMFVQRLCASLILLSSLQVFAVALKFGIGRWTPLNCLRTRSTWASPARFTAVPCGIEPCGVNANKIRQNPTDLGHWGAVSSWVYIQSATPSTFVCGTHTSSPCSKELERVLKNKC